MARRRLSSEYVRVPLADPGGVDRISAADRVPDARLCRRRRLLLLCLSSVGLLVYLARSKNGSLLPLKLPFSQPRVLSAWHNLFHTPSRTRVGQRRWHALYNRGGLFCNSSELLASLENAKIRPDGASRSEYNQVIAAPLDLSSFAFSYDLPNCPPLHVFTPAEACDLIASFGGIFTRGDSLVRQLSQSLFFVLTNSLDVVWDKHEECYGEHLFTHSKSCRFFSYFDLNELGSVCPEPPLVLYEQVWKHVTASSRRLRAKPRRSIQNWVDAPGNYTSFIKSLPRRRQKLSPVVIMSNGLHYNFMLNETLEFHIAPHLQNTTDSIPRPISLWSAYSAPGSNKPRIYNATQGREVVQRYNRAVQGALSMISEGEVSMGAMRSMEWFGVTDGAKSYDGTHYSYQVNMEKIQFVLNLLDTIWGEIVREGGLVV